MGIKWALKNPPEPAAIHWWSAPGGLLSIIAPVLLQSFSKSIRLVLWGFFLSAMWAMILVWPVAHWVSWRIVSAPHLKFFNKRTASNKARIEVGMRRLEECKRWVFHGVHANVFVIFCLLILLIFQIGVRLYTQDDALESRNDVFRKLEIVPENDFRGMSAWVSVKNTSDEDVTINDLICKPAELIPNNGGRILTKGGYAGGGGWDPRMQPIALPHGEATTLPCLSPDWIGSAEGVKIVCADVEWELHYVLRNQPTEEQTKLVRYGILYGTQEWKPLSSMMSGVVNCSEAMKPQEPNK